MVYACWACYICEANWELFQMSRGIILMLWLLGIITIVTDQACREINHTPQTTKFIMETNMWKLTINGFNLCWKLTINGFSLCLWITINWNHKLLLKVCMYSYFLALFCKLLFPLKDHLCSLWIDSKSFNLCVDCLISNLQSPFFPSFNFFHLLSFFRCY